MKEIILISVSTGVYSLDLIQPDSLVVQPGQSLATTCQVSGDSRSTYAIGWIRQREGKAMEWILIIWADDKLAHNNATKNKFSCSRDTSTGAVTLTGQNLTPEDTAVYYCANEISHCDYYFDYWGKGTTVTVTSATATRPTVFPLVPCGSGTGDTVTLGCFATGFTPSSLTFKWTKGGTALTDFIQYPSVLKNDAYTGVSQIQVSRQDWASKQLKCAVEHPGGNADVILEPFKPIPNHLPTLKVLSSTGDENEVTLSCLAKDFSPNKYDIKWLKNDEEVTDKIYEIKTPTEAKKTVNGTRYSAASFLVVKNNDLPDGTAFTCEFNGKNDKGAASVNSSVIYSNDPDVPLEEVKIKIIPPTTKDILTDGKGTVICQVTAQKNDDIDISWENEDKKTLPGSSETSPNGKEKTINVSLDITFNEWQHGVTRPNCSLILAEHQPQRPSVFMMPPVEHTRKEMVTLTCYVKDFRPQEVYVSWLVDDEEADSDYTFSTTNAVKDNGSYFAYGHLSLSLEQWKKNDVVYSCVVYHESLVNATKAIVRSIGHRTFEKTNLVNLNMNIPETCKAQ
uniref:Ig-like domain-containing protein n=1 Tax=Anabas testudineus TaxID=64144 RepID=A0A3Q1JRW9_ANATE